eukprot:5900236-Prymnesium_polylepis.2
MIRAKAECARGGNQRVHQADDVPHSPHDDKCSPIAGDVGVRKVAEAEDGVQRLERAEAEEEANHRTERRGRDGFVSGEEHQNLRESQTQGHSFREARCCIGQGRGRQVSVRAATHICDDHEAHQKPATAKGACGSEGSGWPCWEGSSETRHPAQMTTWGNARTSRSRP